MGAGVELKAGREGVVVGVGPSCLVVTSCFGSVLPFLGNEKSSIKPSIPPLRRNRIDPTSEPRFREDDGAGDRVG